MSVLSVGVMMVTMAAADGANPGLGVLDFAAQGGASNELAAALSTLTSQELERLGVFRVSSAETMRVMLGVERQRQLLGCDTCSGSVLNDLSNYDFVISGKVLKTKTDFTLFMSLVPVGSSAATSSARVSAATETALMQEVRPTVIKLIGKVLEGRQGSIIITSSEVGAAVKVDDSQVGTTPIDAITVGAGPHLISVEKEGFSAVRKEVKVTPDQVTETSVRLVPSPDTISAYESRAKRLRYLAWGTAGLALAGVVLAVVSESRSAALYGDVNVPGTFQYHRAALLRGVEVEGDVNHRTEATALQNQLQTWHALSLTGIGVAAASAVASAVLFIWGEDPAKYEPFHKVNAKPAAPKVSIAPTLGGVVVSGSF